MSWLTPDIPGLGRHRPRGHEFEIILSYMINSVSKIPESKVKIKTKLNKPKPAEIGELAQ